MVGPTRLTSLPSCQKTWQQQEQQQQEAESVFLHQSWSVRSPNQESNPLSSDQKQQQQVEAEAGLALGQKKQL